MKVRGKRTKNESAETGKGIVMTPVDKDEAPPELQTAKVVQATAPTITPEVAKRIRDVMKSDEMTALQGRVKYLTFMDLGYERKACVSWSVSAGDFTVSRDADAEEGMVGIVGPNGEMVDVKVSQATGAGPILAAIKRMVERNEIAKG